MQGLKKVYLYAVSFVTLVISVIGTIMLVNFALNQWWVENGMFSYENPSNAAAMVIVCLPLFFIHWHYARKES